jgi:MinD-like ATPase involved in chromosome partitioning or flagellar assembly
MSLGQNEGRLPEAMPGGVAADLRAWMGEAGEPPPELRWAIADDVPRAGRSFSGRGLRVSRLHVGLAPGRRQLELLETEAAARRGLFNNVRIPTVTPAVITLGSGFGGQGKTMIAAALCIILAMLRAGERVIGLDINADMGNLFRRLGGNLKELPEELWPVTLRDFYQICAAGKINNYTNARDLVAWLQNCAVIRGDAPDARIDHQFGAAEYVDLLEYVQSLFSIIINDGGTKLVDDLHTGALRTTHQYIFVAESTDAGVQSVLDALRFYDLYAGANFTDLMSRAIVVLNKFNAANAKHVAAYEQLAMHLHDTGLGLVAVPHDAALEDRSDTLNLSLVRPGTLSALLSLAAMVLRGINKFAQEVGDPVKASRSPKSNAAVIPLAAVAGITLQPQPTGLLGTTQITAPPAAATTATSVGTGWPAAGGSQAGLTQPAPSGQAGQVATITALQAATAHGDQDQPYPAPTLQASSPATALDDTAQTADLEPQGVPADLDAAMPLV